jgi:hypothetical protein
VQAARRPAVDHRRPFGADRDRGLPVFGLHVLRNDQVDRHDGRGLRKKKNGVFADLKNGVLRLVPAAWVAPGAPDYAQKDDVAKTPRGTGPVDGGAYARKLCRNGISGFDQHIRFSIIFLRIFGLPRLLMVYTLAKHLSVYRICSLGRGSGGRLVMTKVVLAMILAACALGAAGSNHLKSGSLRCDLPPHSVVFITVK